MKKAISVLLSLMLIFTCATPVFAGEAATVSVSPETIEAGDAVQISVTMPSDIPYLTSVGVEVEYDEDAFTVGKAPTGWLFMDDSSSTNVAKGNFSATDPILGDDLAGVEYVFNFTSKADAAAGEYEFNFKFDSGNTFDEFFNEIEIDGGIVTVTIEGEEPVCEHAETEVKDAKEAQIGVPGYTGDKYCVDCGELIEKGTEIPALEDDTTGGGTTGGGTTGGSTTGGSTTGGDDTTGDDTSVITPVGPTVDDTTTGEETGFKYIDVDGHWCEDLIYKWTEKGVIEGVGGNKFAPDGLLTRAQAAAIFTRWLGLEETADISCFADVKAGDWYYDYVAKCYAAGIVKGKAVDQFAPNDYITRVEMFAMLCRALNIEGQTSMSKVFTDADQIPAWAYEYTAALVNNGYVSGLTETTLAPLGNVTRAQMVKLMDNLEGLVK